MIERAPDEFVPRLQWRPSIDHSDIVTRTGQLATRRAFTESTLRGRALLQRVTHVQQNRPGSLTTRLIFDGITKAIRLRHPLGGTQENLAFVLFLWYEHTVKSDVIDDDPVWQVFHGKSNKVLVTVALDPQPGRHGLTWRKRDLQRL